MKNLKKILLTGALAFVGGVLAATTVGASYAVSAEGSSFVTGATETTEFGTDLVLNTAKVKKFANTDYFYNVGGDNVYYFRAENANTMEARFALPGTDFNAKTPNSIGVMPMTSVSFDLKTTAGAGDTNGNGWFFQALEISDDKSVVGAYTGYHFENHFDGEWHTVTIDINAAAVAKMGGFTLKYDTTGAEDKDVNSGINFTGEVLIKNITVTKPSAPVANVVQAQFRTGSGNNGEYWLSLRSSEFATAFAEIENGKYYTNTTAANKIKFVYSNGTEETISSYVTGTVSNKHWADTAYWIQLNNSFGQEQANAVRKIVVEKDCEFSMYNSEKYLVQSNTYYMSAQTKDIMPADSELKFCKFFGHDSGIYGEYATTAEDKAYTSAVQAQLRTGNAGESYLLFVQLEADGVSTEHQAVENNSMQDPRTYLANVNTLSKITIETFTGKSITLADAFDNATFQFHRWTEYRGFWFGLDNSVFSNTAIKVSEVRAVIIEPGCEFPTVDRAGKYVNTSGKQINCAYMVGSLVENVHGNGVFSYESTQVERSFAHIAPMECVGEIPLVPVGDPGKATFSSLWLSVPENTYPSYYYDGETHHNNSMLVYQLQSYYALNFYSKITVNGVRMSDPDFGAVGDGAGFFINYQTRNSLIAVGPKNGFDYRTDATTVVIEEGIQIPSYETMTVQGYANGQTIKYYTAPAGTYKYDAASNSYVNVNPIDAVVSTLHMDENVVGQCYDYYPAAKAAYNALTIAEKNVFATDAVYADAYARLQMWAEAHGETLAAGQNIAKGNNVFGVTSNNNSSMILVIAGVSVVTLAAFVLLKKKKEQ